MTIAGRVVSVTQDGAPCVFDVSGSTAVGSSGGNLTFTIAGPGGCSWSAQESSGFLQRTTAGSGSGSGSVSYSASGNPFTQVRYAEVSVAGRALTVAQDAAACGYGIVPSAPITVAASGGTMTFDIATTAGCGWTAQSASGFLSLASSGSGSGPGGVTYSIEANPGSARSADLAIAGHAVTVTQAANTSACDGSVAVTAASSDAGVFNVSAPDWCYWTVTPEEPGVIIDGSSGAGSGQMGMRVDPASMAPPTSGSLVSSSPQFFIPGLSCTLIPIPCIDSSRCIPTRWCFGPPQNPPGGGQGGGSGAVELVVSPTAGTVTRGQTASFTLFGPGGKGATITAWRFNGERIGQINRTQNVTSISWKGAIVDSGEVTVTFRPAGQSTAITRSARIRVTPRSTFSTPAVTPEKVANGAPQDGCPENLTTPVPVVNVPKALGKYCLERLGRYVQDRVRDNGPNHDARWVQSLEQGNAIRWRYRWLINPDLEDTGCGFYLQQTGTYNPATNMGWISGGICL